MNIHTLMQEQFELAQTYAKDGALYSAAGVLRQLATDIDRHAARADPRTQNLTVPQLLLIADLRGGGDYKLKGAEITTVRALEKRGIAERRPGINIYRLTGFGMVYSETNL